MAATGWRIFSGENIFEKPEISVEEAIWMIETGGINQLVWQESFGQHVEDCEDILNHIPCKNPITVYQFCIPETLNLLTCADGSTNTKQI